MNSMALPYPPHRRPTPVALVEERAIVPQEDAGGRDVPYVAAMLPERRRSALAKLDDVALVAVAVVGVLLLLKVLGFLLGTILLAVKVAIVVAVAAAVWRAVAGRRT